MKRIMNKLITLILIVSTYHISYANNGKVAYAYPVKNMVVDGNFTDWSNQKWMFLREGLPLTTNTKDFQTRFQVGYNVQENAVYFLVEISDNQYISEKSEPWYLVDNLVLYFNPMHSEAASTASMLILNEKGIQLEQPDLSHQF